MCGSVWPVIRIPRHTHLTNLFHGGPDALTRNALTEPFQGLYIRKMHKSGSSLRRKRWILRGKHKRAGGRARRPTTNIRRPHDRSACIQPLDAAFDGDGRDFLEVQSSQAYRLTRNYHPVLGTAPRRATALNLQWPRLERPAVAVLAVPGAGRSPPRDRRQPNCQSLPRRH